MTEAFAGKAAPQARSLGVYVPRPTPLVAQRPARADEIPPAALRFGRAAVAAQWRVEALYALGWCVDSGGHLTGQLRASVLLRMKRGDERASALWSTPWPIPPGVEPPGLDTPPELAAHLPRIDMPARVAALRAQRLALLKTDPVVKWAYAAGVHWVRPAPPLGVIGGEGKSGWWSMTELRQAVLAGAP
jgi:hypothetical protein